MKPYWVADPRSLGHDERTLEDAHDKALLVSRQTGKGVGIYHGGKMVAWTLCVGPIVRASWEKEISLVPAGARIAE